MSDAWIGFLGSVIVAALALVGVISSNKTNNRVMLEQLKAHSEASDAKIEKAQAVTDTKLENLANEVRKHNDFAQRVPVLEEKIKAANKRIDDLEHGKTA